MFELNVMCIDDESYITESIKDYLESSCRCLTFNNPVEALDHLRNEKTDILIIDYRMPELNGLQLLHEAGRLEAYSKAILLTAYADKDLLKDVLNNNLINHVLEKPLNLPELTEIIEELGAEIERELEASMEQQRLSEIYSLLSEPDFDFDFIGKNGDLQNLWTHVVQAAPTDENILITGDTGTGKDVLAKQIHLHSRRAGRPFIKINCGAIPAPLIESELFGHERGAFSGAEQRKLGKIELAHKGTLFLDEIGELPVDMQSRLLHVVEDKALERVGGTDRIIVDFRLVSATNKALEKLNAYEFRRDLFYRISTVHLELPPLCERRNDLPLHILSLIKKISKKYGKPEPELEAEALKLLCEASWPGNIRELENVFKRVLMMKQSDDGILSAADFRNYCFDQGPPSDSSDHLERLADEIVNNGTSLQSIEKALLQKVLDSCGGKAMEASRRTGIPKDRFYRMMEGR